MVESACEVDAELEMDMSDIELIEAMKQAQQLTTRRHVVLDRGEDGE